MGKGKQSGGAWLVATTVIALLIVAGCATTRSEWEKAQQRNSIYVYRQFLRQHPDSEYVPLAKDRIEALAWDDARSRNTVQAYKGFVRSYPRSSFVPEAKHRISGITEELWQRTQQAGSIEAYRRFASQFPDSQHAQIATQKVQAIEAAAWEETCKSGTVEAYANFVRKYPDFGFASQAKAKLKDHIKPEYEKASQDVTSLQRFVNTYPIHTMSKKWQQQVEDRFVELLLSSDMNKRFVIKDFARAASKGIPSRENGSVTIFESGSAGIVGFILEYPKDRQPFGSGGAYLPMGHGTIWRFKGRVTNIMGFTFDGEKTNPLRFILVDGKGLVYLYGRGRVVLKSCSSVALPRQ